MSPAGSRDSRLDLAVAAVALVLVAGGLVRAVLTHREFVAQNPQNLAWIALSLAVGAATFLVNGEGVRLRARTLLWAGYGTFAMLAGFNLQGIVNGSIAHVVPLASRGLVAYLVLGIGAGLCQTVGKWLLVAVLDRVHRPTLKRDVLAAGLAVGLGFGLSEVVFIGSRAIDAGTAVQGLGLLGVWERASAVFFHVYTGGLIAIALALRSALPIVLVVAIHSVDDWVAGASNAQLLGVPLVAVEVFFTAAALATWALFRLWARRLPEDAAQAS